MVDKTDFMQSQRVDVGNSRSKHSAAIRLRAICKNVHFKDQKVAGDALQARKNVESFPAKLSNVKF